MGDDIKTRGGRLVYLSLPFIVLWWKMNVGMMDKNVRVELQ